MTRDGRVRDEVRPWALHAGAPLFLGALIYAGWRTQSLWFWSWARAARVSAALDWLRATLAGLGEPDAWLRYTLPDALWVYALTWSVARLQRGSPLAIRMAWLAVPALLGPLSEIAQAAHLLPGTFDALDLIATLLAFVAGVSLGLRDRPRQASAARHGS